MAYMVCAFASPKRLLQSALGLGEAPPVPSPPVPSLPPGPASGSCPPVPGAGAQRSSPTISPQPGSVATTAVAKATLYTARIAPRSSRESSRGGGGPFVLSRQSTTLSVRRYGHEAGPIPPRALPRRSGAPLPRRARSARAARRGRRAARRRARARARRRGRQPRGRTRVRSLERRRVGGASGGYVRRNGAVAA